MITIYTLFLFYKYDNLSLCHKEVTSTSDGRIFSYPRSNNSNRIKAVKP